MKTKTNLIRLLTGLLLIIVIQINVNSEELELRSSEVMYYSFIYDYPVNLDVEIDLCDWMICPCAFDNNEFYQHLSLDWLDRGTGLFCSPLYDFQTESEENLFINELINNSTEISLMRWMLSFEPIVVNILLEDVKPELLEKWMYDADDFLDKVDLYPQMSDWMLVEDLGVTKTQLDLELWMIMTFSVN